MPLPRLCPYHQQIYETRLTRLRKAVRHPGNGHKALAREATQIASQCAVCPTPPRKDPAP